MKAEEPGQKYGMPIEEAHHIVRRHFQVRGEEAALLGAQVAHDIKVSRALTAARQGEHDAPVVVMPVDAEPEPVSAPQPDWRAKLGLG